MPVTASAAAAPVSLRQELYAGHLLVMQCGARAEQFLDRAEAPRRDPRAEAETLRMAALTSRLMENVRRGMTLAQSGRAPTLVGVDLRSTRAALRAAPTTTAPKLHATPDTARAGAPEGATARRRGRLKNGNPSGDYLRAPRCGARTRAGCPCRQPAMPNGRCRLHGGLSTGARTPEGRRRAQTARLVHGYRSAEYIGLRSRAVQAARRLRALTTTPRPAGHGVHRPDSVNRRDAEAQRIRRGGMVEPLPARAARNNHSSSASPRLCGESSAGHGVDRSNPISRGWKAAVRWLLKGKEGAQARRQTIAVPGCSGFAPM
jgi:hypothetical protein